MYILHVTTCNKSTGETQIPRDEAYDTFATYADLLFLGEDLNMQIPDAGDSHPVRITLLYADDSRPTEGVVVSSVFLLCDHNVEVKSEETAVSKLYLPGGVR